MRYYRALEFSKLQYLLEPKAHLFWIQNELNFSSKDKVNWWMEDDKKTVVARNALASSVVKHSKDKFFRISAEFNSINGGRFNPKQSWGALYCSNSHMTAALEVLYHQFNSAYSNYSTSVKNKANIHTNFNRRIADKVEVKIIVFEFEKNSDEHMFYPLNDGQDSLEEDCKSHGFDRYLTSTFDRDFIFGNDYIISQILGCSIHSKAAYCGIQVPSARLNYELQDNVEPKIRNFVIPEKDIPSFNFDFTKKFVEYHFEIFCDFNSNGHHDVLMTVKGQTYKFEIQKFPDRKNDRDKQIKIFEHVTPNIGEKKLREVVTQKYQ